MTQAETILRFLLEMGVKVHADGDTIRFKAPPGIITPELKETMRPHKEAMLAMLRIDRQGNYHAKDGSVWKPDGTGWTLLAKSEAPPTASREPRPRHPQVGEPAAKAAVVAALPSPPKLQRTAIDKVKNVLTESSIFNDALGLLSHISRLTDRITCGNSGKPLASGRDLGLHRERVSSAIGELQTIISMNRPVNICPYCMGENSNCSACRGNGWATKYQWESAPPQFREATTTLLQTAGDPQ